jgi:hypothetical protein
MAQFSLYTLLSCGIGQQADANPFQDCAVPAINSSLQFNPPRVGNTPRIERKLMQRRRLTFVEGTGGHHI